MQGNVKEGLMHIHLYYTVKRIRLVNGNTSTEGRVEIYHEDVWGTICDDNWDINDANVVCRMLGLPGAVKAVPKPGFGPGSNRIWMDEVKCTGTEKSIEDCPRNAWGVTDCSHAEDAGVICQRIPLQNEG